MFEPAAGSVEGAVGLFSSPRPSLLHPVTTKNAASRGTEDRIRFFELWVIAAMRLQREYPMGWALVRRMAEGAGAIAAGRCFAERAAYDECADVRVEHGVCEPAPRPTKAVHAWSWGLATRRRTSRSRRQTGAPIICRISRGGLRGHRLVSEGLHQGCTAECRSIGLSKAALGALSTPRFLRPAATRSRSTVSLRYRPGSTSRS